MAKVNAQLLGFNAGEVSKLALARVDLAKMRLSADSQLNWLPWVMGPMMLRPGLLYVGEVYDDVQGIEVPFVFSKLDTALLELTPNLLRVRVGEALVTRVAVGTVVLDPTFTGSGSHWTTSNTTAGCTATYTGGKATLTASARGGLAQIDRRSRSGAGTTTKNTASGLSSRSVR